MNPGDLINKGIELGAYALRKRGGEVTEDLPSIEDLEKELDQLYLKSPNSSTDEAVALETVTPTEKRDKVSHNPASTPVLEEAPKVIHEQNDIATACIPCTLGHVSVSAGLLNEAVRFKDDGITSNEILDRIAKILSEMNALERVDLTPEKILKSPKWVRDLAEEALRQSRQLRHKLEAITTIGELEEAAADTEAYYRTLNREYFKRRLANMSGEEKKKKIKQRAEELLDKELGG